MVICVLYFFVGYLLMYHYFSQVPCVEVNALMKTFRMKPLLFPVCYLLFIACLQMNLMVNTLSKDYEMYGVNITDNYPWSSWSVYKALFNRVENCDPTTLLEI